MIQAMENPESSEPSVFNGVDEISEALREAEQKGFVFDPYSLEDHGYGPAEIQEFLTENGRVPFPNVYGADS